MTTCEFACHVFDSSSLLPAAWRAAAAGGAVRAFNPGLLRHGNGWTLAYRVVLADGIRRIAFCRLDADLRVIPGSPFPFSDLVRFPDDAPYPPIVRQWLADPRLYRWGGRAFVYWNSGWHEPQNHQFLQEFDPTSFAPLGAPRELVLRGTRRPLEKNWTLFAEPDGHLRAIYSVLPHRVLAFSLEGTGDILCEETRCEAWTLAQYPSAHGGLRGGAPPVWHDGAYWSFCHSVHDGADGYCYATGVYAFAGGPAFQPTAEPMRPLDLGREARAFRLHPRLNPAVNEVIYPCGAALVGTRWVVSHGINDERCALSFVPHAAVQACVQPRRF